MKTLLSDFVGAFGERCSCSHVLIQLIENWKRALNEKFQIEAALMGLCKVFGCLFIYYLLIAKLDAYGLSEETTPFFFS